MYKRYFLSALLFLFWIHHKAQPEVYELRTYQLEFFRPADVLHNYLKNALIPALNRQGIQNIGVFEEYGETLPATIYLVIPYNDIQVFVGSKEVLDQDQQYLKDANSYLKADQNSIPFENYTSNLIRASSGFPNLMEPSQDSNLFELRIYESHNEDALRRKVKMFNDSEFKIFEDVNLPMVFFGYNIAGTQMPCLTYLLAFEDMEANKAAWAKFGPHPEWQRITKLEEYATSMNDITRVFLRPMEYSQL